MNLSTCGEHNNERDPNWEWLKINTQVPKCKPLQITVSKLLTGSALRRRGAKWTSNNNLYLKPQALHAFFYLNLRTCRTVVDRGKLNPLSLVVHRGVANPLGAFVIHRRILYPLSSLAAMWRILYALSPSVMMPGVTRSLPSLVRPVAGVGIRNQSPA